MRRQTSTLIAGAMPLLGMAAFGAASVPLAAALGETSPRLLLAGAAGVLAFTGLVVAGYLRQILLILYVILLTYNRQYFSFDWLHGDLGSRGLYWCPSDLCLLGLLILWPVERAMGVPPLSPRPGMAVWLMPLIVVAMLSALMSIEPVGSCAEVARYGKIAILLVYLRWNLDQAAARVIVAALAAAILAQCPIAILQVGFASGQNGLSQIFQTSEPSELARRAAGTLGHPNYLAPYLLLTVPPFATIALGLWRTRLGYAAAVIAGSGILTIVLTQSRAPIVLISLAMAGLIVVLTVRGQMPTLRAVGLGVAAATLATLAALPIAGQIEKRLTGDLDASIDFRASYNEAALRMWEASPALGVGPNNFGLRIREFSPDLYVVMALDTLATDEVRNKIHLRSVAPVHNVYLLVLSELGMAGLAAFLLLLGRGLTLAWSASARMPEPEGLFGLGMCCGLLVEGVQQTLDYSLLWDPLLFTLALTLGLVRALVPSMGKGS